jgi:hypothetical protein
MILIGHKDITFSPMYRIVAAEDIAQTPPKSTVLFEYDALLAHYCHENTVSFAIHVKHTKELVLSQALGASFLVVDKALSLNAQKIAEQYLFDAKILLLSMDDNDIEWAALNAIDGILFHSAIQGL